ncbi:MAG: hypothetical protein ACREPP_10880 [Rhodanobacteraceae bacterium]
MPIDFRRCCRTGAPSPFVTIVAGILTAFAVAPVPARAGKAVDVPVPQPILTSNQMLAAAVPDECFNGIGIDYPPINADGTCPVGQPKINESRIWALTEESGKLWFGTLANYQCVLTGQVKGAGAAPFSNDLLVCEFGKSEGARGHPNVPPNLGDWRQPSIYSYDLATSTLTKQNIADPLIKQTLGFRGAGSIDNIAFLGGQNLFAGKAAVNIFAFQADTGEYLGSCSIGGYNYIRGWALVDGALYVGAGSTTHGAVLRWNGSRANFPGNFCTQFSEVASLPAAVANLALYTGADGKDRLAATTVALKNADVSASAAATVANGVGAWISPPIPEGGFVAPATWRQVWSPTQYDPDTITARYGYSGGAVVQYDGWLYWGTIHLNGDQAMQVHESCTGAYCFGKPANRQQTEDLKNGVYRSTSVWRGRNLENPKTREIQLLYGESELPACCSAPKTFTMTPTGWTPLYGPSGFGNPNNEYTWQMAVFDGHLFIGTYDTSNSQVQSGQAEAGADLWRFDDSNSPAVNENYTGLGNNLNSGIRALHALDDGSGLIVGTSDGFNLSPVGGWELMLLKAGGSQ